MMRIAKLLVLLLVLCSCSAGAQELDIGTGGVKQYEIHYSQGTNNTVANSTVLTATYTTLVVDNSGGAYDGTATYTFPIAGNYQFEVAFSYAANAGGLREIVVFINGGQDRYFNVLSVGASFPTASVVVFSIRGAAGTSVSLKHYQDSGAPLTLPGVSSGLNHQYIKVRRVGP